jgi:hypothetical protein
VRVGVGEREQQREVVRAAAGRGALKQRDGAPVVAARGVERAEVEDGLRVRGRDFERGLKALDGLRLAPRAREQDAEVGVRGGAPRVEPQSLAVLALGLGVTPALIEHDAEQHARARVARVRGDGAARDRFGLLKPPFGQQVRGDARQRRHLAAPPACRLPALRARARLRGRRGLGEEREAEREGGPRRRRRCRQYRLHIRQPRGGGSRGVRPGQEAGPA